MEGERGRRGEGELGGIAFEGRQPLSSLLTPHSSPLPTRSALDTSLTQSSVLSPQSFSFTPSRQDPIHWLSKDLKTRFGGNVRKASLDAGFTCPNRDGTLRTGGCVWCDPSGSGPDDLAAGEPWPERLRRLASAALDRGDKGVIAYFQAYTNTHGADPGNLERAWRSALAVPGVLGLAVGTRPDCLPPPVLDLFEEMGRGTFLWVEIGMQTSCDHTLEASNRGHGHAVTVAAVEALKTRGLRVVLHLILGLPGEDKETILASLAEAARLRPWGVKFHPLHVVRGSAIEKDWREGNLPLLDLDGYARLAADGLELLPPETTVHRLTGERPGGLLLAPEWCRDKHRTLGAIQRELARRQSWQGSRWPAR